MRFTSCRSSDTVFGAALKRASLLSHVSRINATRLFGHVGVWICARYDCPQYGRCSSRMPSSQGFIVLCRACSPCQLKAFRIPARTACFRGNPFTIFCLCKCSQAAARDRRAEAWRLMSMASVQHQLPDHAPDSVAMSHCGGRTERIRLMCRCALNCCAVYAKKLTKFIFAHCIVRWRGALAARKALRTGRVS